ncbi:MAG: DUF438 domain-containing protein, partial [Dehalococcoidales bacterium]
MASKEELKQVLRELNQQGDSTLFREKAKKFLKNVDAKTLSLAEQELMQEGIQPEHLHSLCEIHLDVLGSALEQQRPELEKTHPVCILMDEHEIILQNLEELRGIIKKVKVSQGFDEIKGQLERLRAVAHLLLETESHHQREEEALFPKLEKHGVTGPPQMMRLEHDDLRAKKKRLAELAEQAENMDYKAFSQKLSEVGGYIAGTLKDHIFKEDHILYPTTLQTLEAKEWSEV